MGGLLSSLCNPDKEEEKVVPTKQKPEGSNPTKGKTKGGEPEDGKTNKLDQDRAVAKLQAPKKPLTSESGSQLGRNNFEWKKYIGRGTFGKVAVVVKKDNQKVYAMKIIKKKDINVSSTVENAMTERDILMKADHPFIVKLRYSFQDEQCLYYCMDYVPGGELFKYLKSSRKFNLEQTRFYAVEVLLAIEYLHNELKIMYRDLKPENILVDSNGHIKLADFGLSKIGVKQASSFCGTPDYLAPEIINGKGHDNMVDYWTFGCLIYEMLMGHPPFSSNSTSGNKNLKQLYEAIKIGKFAISTKLDENAKDLIKRLLNTDPRSRLGANGSEEVKKHPFFKNIPFEEFLKLNVQPPFIPDVKHAEVSGFVYSPTPDTHKFIPVPNFTYMGGEHEKAAHEK